jgi:hypothetical protein
MEILKNREYMVTYSYYSSGTRNNMKKISLSLKESESWENVTDGVIAERLQKVLKSTDQSSEITIINFWLYSESTSGIENI